MTIFCDESGGISAGAMTLAAVQIDASAADALLRRFKTVTGLRGELKGSRIDLVERALFFELFERYGGRASVGIVYRAERTGADNEGEGEDLRAYSHLLDAVIGYVLPETGGCVEVVIDDGRYDPKILTRVRNDVAAALGGWGQARLEDSHRSSGVQIADVIANSIFNLAINSQRAWRIDKILDPFIASGIVRLINPIRRVD